MLSCFALHIFSLYTARNYLITTYNCHCTYCTCTTHVSVDQRASAHPPTPHIACFPTFWEAWPMPKPSPIRQHNPHSMPTCSTHQVTTINSLTSVHAFSQHPLAQYLAHSICCTSSCSLVLPCTQATKPTHKQLATKPPMSCTTT